MNRLIPSLLSVCLILVLGSPGFAAEVRFWLPKITGGPGQEVIVPVYAKTTAELGCMQLALAYDPAILEIKTVEAGPALPDGALIDFNKDDAGWLRTGFVCSPSKPGFKGDGAVLHVKMFVKGAVGQESKLFLEQVRAWESSDPEFRVLTEQGGFTVVQPIPWLWIGVAGGVFVLLVLFIFSLRRLRSQPHAVPASIAAATGRTCPACKARVAYGQAFCGQCGTAMSRACTCGQALQPGATFCTACGKKVT